MMRLSDRASKISKTFVDLLLTPLADFQAVQVPADGLRDGYMGNDIAVDCAEEGLQVDLLSCECDGKLPDGAHPTMLTPCPPELQKRMLPNHRAITIIVRFAGL